MYRKTVNFIKKHQKGLKQFWLITMCCLVAFAIYSAYQQISVKAIIHTCTSLTWFRIGFMFILGVIMILPMTIYDFIYVRKINRKTGYLRLFKNSFITNTFANIGGGGGLLGIDLRAFLFGKVPQKVLKTTSLLLQIAIFTIIGLAPNDVLAIILNWHLFWHLPSFIRIVCLLFPFSLLLIFVVPNQLLKLKDFITLYIGSSFEWLCALAYFVIVGLIMGIHFSIIKGYLMICFAGIIGVISFIPGGIGSLDSALILGMKYIGISANTSSSWALMYRFGYYIIPFAIGGILLVITLIKRYVESKN